MKVQLGEDTAPLEAICIADECRTFDPSAEVRTGEFSAFAEPEESFTLRFVGQDDLDGGSAPVGGCMLVYIDEGTTYLDGCRPIDEYDL